MGDARLGWGAPTILVDGEDLFGPSSDDGSVSCRNWGDGLPSVLKKFENSSGIKHVK